MKSSAVVKSIAKGLLCVVTLQGMCTASDAGSSLSLSSEHVALALLLYGKNTPMYYAHNNFRPFALQVSAPYIVIPQPAKDVESTSIAWPITTQVSPVPQQDIPNFAQPARQSIFASVVIKRRKRLSRVSAPNFARPIYARPLGDPVTHNNPR